MAREIRLAKLRGGFDSDESKARRTVRQAGHIGKAVEEAVRKRAKYHTYDYENSLERVRGGYSSRWVTIEVFLYFNFKKSKSIIAKVLCNGGWVKWYHVYY